MVRWWQAVVAPVQILAKNSHDTAVVHWETGHVWWCGRSDHHTNALRTACIHTCTHSWNTTNTIISIIITVPLLVAQHPSNMLAYIRDGSAQAMVCAATLRPKLQIKLSISPSHNMLTQGQPVLRLALKLKVTGREAISLPVIKSLVWLHWGKPQLAGKLLEYQLLSHWNDSTEVSHNWQGSY